ncbi:cytochrome P450 82G1-like [Coffea eugenioides]|uniref:cytochrome P450 82G1-like n=1 Tax=Coffea eugenioides TaxID=49369 RepID=UPI000F6084A5|nr:cytochrome P450 82G1-like [Coffea eugenioides]
MENLYCCLITILSCSLLLISKNLLFNHVKNKKLPPSPLALPIIGHLYLIKNSLFQDLTSLSAKYGPIFFLQFGWRSFVVVSSPAAIEECFTQNDITLANRPRTMAGDRLTYNYTGPGVAPYGDLWRVLRGLFVVESLSFNSLQRTSVIREEECQMILRSIYRVSKNESQVRVDLSHWISIFTLNVMMRMLVGRCSVREEDAGEELGMQIIEEFREMFGSSISMNLCDFFPVLSLYPAAPLLQPHYASEDCKVGMYDIPKVQLFLANAWAVHRDPNIWEEPEKFNCQKDSEVKKLDGQEAVQFPQFLPFGMGRRACPGANLGISDCFIGNRYNQSQCFDWDKVEQEWWDFGH